GVATATNIFAPCWIITTTRATSPRAIVCEDETMIYELRDQPAGRAGSRHAAARQGSRGNLG
ncbi:hypothetical protein, partial [Paracoccus sp. M683]|uniref:hypothetical protein n=1 Tax=Paracoccus sp. M683 TaxID=2594268 RepID=UPI001C8F5D32